MKKRIAVAIAAALICAPPGVFAGQAEADKWINKEFQPSTLSKAEQKKEMADRKSVV